MKAWFGTVAEWGKRALARRWLPVALALLAIAFSWPALKTGLLTDDYMQRAVAIGPSDMTDRLDAVGLAPEGTGGLWTVLADLYVAVSPEKNLTALTDYGALPWWTYEGYRVAFWRPLASLTYWLDYRLFPDSLVLMHLHSILWFAAVVFAATLFYRRMIDTAWIAGLAALFFVLDDGPYFATMWLANRNLMLCLVFSLLTLIAYDRWRREGWRPGGAVVPACLLAALLSAEAGLATCAYLFAYEVCLGHGRWTRRLAALLPSVVVVLVWRVLYNVLGYGAAGGGFYFDPGREPVGYALVVLWRLPFLLAGQWATIPPDLHNFMPGPVTRLVWAVGVVIAVGFPLLMWPFLKSHARARFWLIGMYLSALPFCATIPMGRSLAFVAIGGFGLVAEFVAAAGRRALWMPGGRWRARSILVLAGFFAVAYGPMALLSRCLAPGATAALQAIAAKVTQIDSGIDLARKDLVLVNPPNPSGFLYEPFAWASEGRLLPGHVRTLAPGYGEVLVERAGPNRLVIRSAEDSLFDCQRHGRPNSVYFYRYLSDFRGTAHPCEAGQTFKQGGMTVTVQNVDGRGWPVQIAVEFDVGLDDPALCWLWWDWGDRVYRPFELPLPGEVRRLGGPF